MSMVRVEHQVSDQAADQLQLSFDTSSLTQLPKKVVAKASSRGSEVEQLR